MFIRRALVTSILQAECRYVLRELCNATYDLEEVRRQSASMRTVEDGWLCRKCKVLGATVTGALMFLDTIIAAKPSALLFEEAAECPEVSACVCLCVLV